MTNDVKPPKPTLLARLFLLLFAFVVTLLVVEAGLRIIAPHALDESLQAQLEHEEKNAAMMQQQSTVMKVFDPLFHHSTFPNRTMQGTLEDHPYRFTTNNKGFRWLEDFEEAKGKDVYRIALTGDSFTVGLYVDDMETYAFQVNAMLKQTAGKKNWQLYNFANVSYSPLLYWQQYSQIISKYHPDLLVLAIDNSDLQDDYYYEHDAIFDESGNLKGFKDEHYSFFLGQVRNIGTPEERVEAVKKKINSPLSNLWGWSLSHLQLAAHIRDFLNRSSFKPGDIESDRFGHCREGVDWSPHWERTAKYLDKTIQMAKKDGVEVLIVFYPYPHQVNGTDWPSRTMMGYKMGEIYGTPMRKWLADFALKEHVAFLDAFDDFRKSGIHDFTFKGDPHYLPNGHSILAQSVCGYLVSHYNLPPADADQKNSAPAH